MLRTPPTPTESALSRSFAAFRNQSAAPESPPMHNNELANLEEFGMIVSTRPNVGKPDYSLHPPFVDHGWFVHHTCE